MTLNMTNIAELTKTWLRLHDLAHDAIAPIQNDEDYDRALVMLDQLLEHIGENDQHPLADLLEGLIARVVAYQETAQHVPRPNPDMQLRLLLESKGLTQQQLAATTGITPDEISNLANGQQAFSATQAKTLADVLGVSPNVFYS